ncbi:Alkaline phosphatase synthesis transcriptional regulatory protein PhoP [Gemmata obscuriglobus]|uniref:Response regulator n=1 Tax=Gemmata obscuriglobus TaxID=114 RepID=A0A2Z3GPC6_9BACT|nr:response regulator [Gemmata obscuriglobus]AWM35653.1 response regulator [Gemmata obscuriglobus]QEG31819.1 Alkaline phosphatase synthesis transcriptional regulatory protein PhoP [Gemmata obscuriglobus]VTS11165.1 chemotaxis protein : Chemotaxis protein CheY OS=Desulfobulbus sp. Tol-SR GN=JT06_11205 PE=4 SV=1: Response_reg [Gemmata obscuriglobus UQM 2246]
MPNDTILVVDDSPTEQRVVVSALQAKGYRVITAADGDEAIEKAGREQPRLIVLDVVMPKKNGYQVCRQLKSAPETQHIKVLMLTTKNQDADKFWGMKQGADAYLTKPFASDELITNVTRLY